MERAERVIAFIERYLKVPEGAKVGQPLELAEFQKRFIRDLYTPGVRNGILSISRKGGKSGLIACLLLAHLVGPEAKLNTQIVSGARSRDQAALVFDLARKMVNLSEDLSSVVRIVPSGKRLIGLPRNVEYKALAAEGTTAHGLSPVVAILDELGQVKGPQDDFVDAITTSQGAHDEPLLITISTQAPTDNDMLSRWIDDARTSADPRTVCHVYEAPEDAALDDQKAWLAANPALGIFRSVEDVQAAADKAVRLPSSESAFRLYYLNQRVNMSAPFITRKVWEQSADEPEAPNGRAAFAGLDLSSRTDLTAFVLVYQGDDGRWNVRAKHWAPDQGLRDRAKRDRVPYDVWAKEGWLETTPGATVDYEYVARSIAEMLEDYDIRAVAYDRWRIELMRKEFSELGLDLPLIEYGQGYRDMSPALDTLEADLLNGRLRHGNNPVLNMCAANATATKDPAGNRKLDKSKATGRIDGMVALAMARAVAEREDDAVPDSPFEDPGFRLPG